MSKQPLNPKILTLISWSLSSGTLWAWGAGAGGGGGGGATGAAAPFLFDYSIWLFLVLGLAGSWLAGRKR